MKAKHPLFEVDKDSVITCIGSFQYDVVELEIGEVVSYGTLDVQISGNVNRM
jgi:hypothetical protein